jgi:hypothetical protein
MLKNSQIGPLFKLGAPETEPDNMFTEENKEERIESVVCEPQEKITRIKDSEKLVFPKDF